METPLDILSQLEKQPKKDAISNTKWANGLRVKAKDLSSQLDTGYMELGRVLYQIWDAPPTIGDNKAVGLFTQWGFKDFEDYVNTELHIDRRKAERLRRIAYTLEVELSGLDPTIKERIIKLGWTKVRELIAVPLTLRNAASWADVGEKMNGEQLRMFVRDHREKKYNEQRAQALPDIPQLPVGDLETLSADSVVHEGSSTQVSSRPSYEDALGSEEEREEALNPLPEMPEKKPNWKHFMLFDDQMSVVETALERAGQIAQSTKVGHLLTLICMNYLATNDFLQGGEEQLMRVLAMYEELLGVKLIAVDPEDWDVRFGLTTLDKLAAENSPSEDPTPQN